MKNIRIFYLKNCHFLVVQFSVYLNRHVFVMRNRKKCNDQESIQLPNTFRSKTPKGKRDALKATAPQLKHYKQKANRTVSFPKIGQMAIQNKNFSRTYMQIHTMTETVNHGRGAALEQSVKYHWGWGALIDFT